MPLTLARRLASLGLTSQSARECPPRHAKLREDPIAHALRLFRDGATLSRPEADSLLDGTDLPAGLLLTQGELLQSAYRLHIVADHYFFSDWPSGKTDEVLPPGETTAILYRASRQIGHIGTLLDVGCGSGTLALLLSRQADYVLATDVNSRAIALAKLNATANGIANVGFRTGSLLAPVKGLKFDLVVSQPPYIPHVPNVQKSLFLHGGAIGDQISRQLLASVVDHLVPSGTALVFSDWPLTPIETLREKVSQPGSRTEVYRSVPIALGAYARSYGEGIIQHLQGLGITHVTQALTIVEEGTGYHEYEVLANEWANLKVARLIQKAKPGISHQDPSNTGR